MKKIKIRIAIIPTMLTLGNAVCGFAAIAYAGKIGLVDSTPKTDSFYFALSGWLIIAAMIFDALDGYVARLSRSTSRFGGELDSLCDAVSFGAAPAFLLLRLGPGWDRAYLHQLLAVVATLYLVCAVLRLARYNVDSLVEGSSKKKFSGLPSPAAAGCLASLAIMRGNLGDSWLEMETPLMVGAVETWAMLGAFMVALLMVSQVPYPHLTKQLLRGRKHFNHLIQLVLAVFAIVMLRELAVVVIFWGYVAAVLMQVAVDRIRHHEALPPVATEETAPH